MKVVFLRASPFSQELDLYVYDDDFMLSEMCFEKKR